MMEAILFHSVYMSSYRSLEMAIAKSPLHKPRLSLSQPQVPSYLSSLNDEQHASNFHRQFSTTAKNT
jgi:hypothetical protein